MTVNGIAAGPATVGDGSLSVALPRQLRAGTFPVSLSFASGISPVLLDPGITYTLPSHMVTGLRLLDMSIQSPATPIAQIAAWQATGRGTLDLAVLGGSPNQILLYRNSGVNTRMATFPQVGTASAPSGQTLQTGNLAVPDDGLGLGNQDLLAALGSAGSMAFYVQGTSTPVGKLASLQPSYPLTHQLVAGGYFRDGAGAVQGLTFVGWQSGSTSMPVELNSGPALSTASTSFFGNNVGLQTAIMNPQPVAVATALLNDDATTDVVLLVGAALGGTNNVAYAINGGSSPAAVPFQNLPMGATSVALGNLDKDWLPDVVFGVNPGNGQAGQLRIYLNQSGKSVPSITWDMTNPIQTVAPLAPTAVAIADYDGDGVNDILYATSAGVQVLINQLDANNRPQLAATQIYAAPKSGWSVSSLVAVDFSGDSRPDVILADSMHNTVLFLENSCSPPTP